MATYLIICTATYLAMSCPAGPAGQRFKRFNQFILCLALCILFQSYFSLEFLMNQKEMM